MKRITPVEIATVFTGSFLGAGFLSGQELLQFFGAFGGFGLAGMALAISAFVLFSLLIIRIARQTGRTEFDRVIIGPELPWLRYFVSGVFLFFLFDVAVAMLAGAGTLLEEVFGLPFLAGSALTALLVLGVALTGTAGMLASFNIIVPLLVATALIVSIAAALRLPAAPVQARPFSDGNPLLGNWLCSALSFISYNMMAAVSILVPLSVSMEEKHTIRRGLALGTVLLTLIFAGILLPMILFREEVGKAQLPMLELAFHISRPLGLLYAVLLQAGMFTAALSSTFAITARAVPAGRSAIKLTVCLCALAFAGSLFGFKNMVSFVYPICGYIGFLALGGILHHAHALSRRAKSDGEAGPPV